MTASPSTTSNKLDLASIRTSFTGFSDSWEEEDISILRTLSSSSSSSSSSPTSPSTKKRMTTNTTTSIHSPSSYYSSTSPPPPTPFPDLSNFALSIASYASATADYVSYKIMLASSVIPIASCFPTPNHLHDEKSLDVMDTNDSEQHKTTTTTTHLSTPPPSPQPMFQAYPVTSVTATASAAVGAFTTAASHWVRVGRGKGSDDEEEEEDDNEHDDDGESGDDDDHVKGIEAGYTVVVRGGVRGVAQARTVFGENGGLARRRVSLIEE